MTEQIQLITNNVIGLLIEDLFIDVWKGIATQNIIKMAPKSTFLQTEWTLKSFVNLAFTEQFRRIHLIPEKDPRAPSLDTFGTGSIDVQGKQLQKNEGKIRKMTDVSFVSDGKSLKTKKSSKAKNLKIEEIKQNDKKSISDKIQFTQLEQQSCLIDLKEETLRNIANNEFVENHNLEIQKQQKQRQKQEKAKQSEKLLKEKKQFTFSYEGSYHAINTVKLTDLKVNRLKQKYLSSSIKPLEMKTIEGNIQNQKMKDRDIKSIKNNDDKNKPIFSTKTMHITDAFQDSLLSEGIKLTQIKGQNDTIVKEKRPRKLSGIKMYRLKEYKTYSKDLSFRQYPSTSSKKQSLFDLSLTPQNKEQSMRLNSTQKQKSLSKEVPNFDSSSKARQTQAILQTALGRGLPFIRTKGLRFHDIGSNNLKSSTISNFSSSKKSKDRFSTIKIGDTILYQQNFLN